MKIVYACADSGVSLAKHNGSAAHLRAIVAAFRTLGHEVEVLLADTLGAETLDVPVRLIPRPAFARALTGVTRRAFEEPDRSTPSLRALRRLWINPGLETALDESIDRFGPDLVYERHSPFIVAGPIVCARRGTPHILEVNAPLAWEGARHRAQALPDEAELLERAAFAACTDIVAVSDELRDQLVRTGVDAGKIRVVPNGVDVRRFDGVEPQQAGREDEVVVGFVGSLKSWHGVESLTRAFESLASRHPRLHLLVVGDGPLGEHVGELRSRLPGRVTWTGAIAPEGVPGHIAAMDIGVAPYPDLDRFYFSPLKVLEYMAGGAAIVASRIGQLESLVTDEESGLLVPPGDVDALTRALERLVEDAALRRRLGERAREDARTRHDWTRRATEILRPAGSAAA